MKQIKAFTGETPSVEKGANDLLTHLSEKGQKADIKFAYEGGRIAVLIVYEDKEKDL